jgi:hypothetical protein
MESPPPHWPPNLTSGSSPGGREELEIGLPHTHKWRAKSGVEKTESNQWKREKIDRRALAHRRKNPNQRSWEQEIGEKPRWLTCSGRRSLGAETRSLPGMACSGARETSSEEIDAGGGD